MGKSWLVKADADVGFIASLEVMSKTAAAIFFQNAESCYTGELNWKASKIAKKYGWYGEDLFAQKCMDRHGVKKIWDFGMVTDGTCEASRPAGQKKNLKWTPDPDTCRAARTPAYKPLKSSKDYFACLGAITGVKYS